MKKIVLLTGLVTIFCGCRSTPDAVPDRVDDAPVEQVAAQAPGPFEVAAAWRGTDDSPATAELLRSFAQPVVERMHRTTDGFAALIIDAETGAAGEGILLMLVEEAGVWRVKSSEIVRADYLWPTQ